MLFFLEFIINSEYLYFSGLTNNIATKYGLEPTQITVSSVEDSGMTSFQIMPFFVEDMDTFQKKMNQIDNDVCFFKMLKNVFIKIF